MLSFKQFLQEELKRIQGQLGSNEGGVYHDSETGEKYYMKFPKNPDQAKSEVLSGKIQTLMGIKNIPTELINHEGKIGVKSKWQEGLTPVTLEDSDKLDKEHHITLGKMFAHGVLTKNWDTLGSYLDSGSGNFYFDKEKNIVHGDLGGSFQHRAQGAPKPYNSDISEVNSLRDPKINFESAKVFNTAFKKTPEAIHHGIQAVKNLKDEDVHEAFKNSGLSNWKELHKTFHERKKNFLDHFGA